MLDLISPNIILRGVVGSTAHGTAIDGQDDCDLMGVFIESPKNVCGLVPLSHYIQRDQPEGVRSQPGDTDLTLYSLRKFCGLAAQGNPSVVILLWLPAYDFKTKLGQRLINLRHDFISQDSGKRFLGYLQAQRKRLTGELSRAVNRPELVEKYGYDTKFAMHALRLGFEGIELLTDFKLTLPVKEPELTILRNVRTGKYIFKETLELIDDTEQRLKVLVEKCSLNANLESVDRFLINAHIEHWETLGVV